MLHIGCHLSSSKGFAGYGPAGAGTGGGHLSVFHPESQGSKAKDLDPADAAALAAPA